MVTVLVSSYFEEEYVRRIREVDERLEVLYREDLVPPPLCSGDHVGPSDWQRSPDEDEEFLAILQEAEILYDFPRGHIEDLTEAAPKLRWVQGSMAGAGEVARRAGLLETEVVVTTARGIYSAPLAEFALGAMLSHTKSFDHLRHDKKNRVWNGETTGTLEDKKLCILGMGSIAQAVALRARAFGMRITGVKRTVRDKDEAWQYADELYTTDHLREALGEAEYVVVTLPSTPKTEHLLDAEAIRSMKPGTYFVNIGRGTVVDETALADALQHGHLSGAALDVFEVEPLPEDSPLWDLDNVIISPHATDNVPGLINARQTDLFCENLRRYLAGETLLNVLDKDLLY